MTPSPLLRFWNHLVGRFSFDKELMATWESLNAELDRPGFPSWPPSHPSGFIREFRRRRLTIAEAYLTLVKHLDSTHKAQRLEALGLLRAQAFHAKGVKMPLNTARVQVALMKRFVKRRGDRRSQLECLRDFSLTSFAQPALIRKTLDKMNMVEVPETNAPLCELNLGFDDHVHDNSSYGRKTASQLVLDAFLKGLSRITVVHTSFGHPEIMEEALEAGAILGVHVNVAVEFSVGPSGNRFHLIYRFPPLPHAQALRDFLHDKFQALQIFKQGLATNQERRLKTIEALLRHFNETHLPLLNEGWNGEDSCTLSPLRFEDLAEVVPLSHATRMHLGVLLANKLEPIFSLRQLILTGRLQILERGGEGGTLALEHVNRCLEALNQDLATLNPDDVRRKYLHHPELQEYESAFQDTAELAPLVLAAGGGLYLIHPLERGFEAAAETLLKSCPYLAGVEVFNMVDHAGRDPHDLVRLARLVHLLSEGDRPSVQRALTEWGLVKCIPFIELALSAVPQGKGLQPMIGSDSTGRMEQVPGMGFISSNQIPPRQRARYCAAHLVVPPHLLPVGEKPVVSMGKTLSTLLDGPPRPEVIPFGRAWRYLNPFWKNLLTVATGFLAPFFMVGPFYASLWFGITGLRNAVVDMAAQRGSSPKFWNPKLINFDNLAVSLFFTGFSVPLLTLVKAGFDHYWAWGQFHQLTVTTKFLLICVVNGFYLFSHNLLRGFDLPTSRLNIFRSLIAWPLATAFAPLGDFLNIPAVVQAKIWSDFVAGLIEGSGKSLAIGDLRRRNLLEVLTNLKHVDESHRLGASIDLLFFFATDPRSRKLLPELLDGKPNWFERTRLRLTKERPPDPLPEEGGLIRQFLGDTRHLSALCRHAVKEYRPEEAAQIQNWVIPAYFDLRKQVGGGVQGGWYSLRLPH